MQRTLISLKLLLFLPQLLNDTAGSFCHDPAVKSPICSLTLGTQTHATGGTHGIGRAGFKLAMHPECA